MFGLPQMTTTLSDRVTCPYDPSHSVKFSRFHSHFLNCQQRYPNDTRKPCPYNFSELIEPEKLTEHLMQCPYRMCYGVSRGDKDVPTVPKINAPFNIKFGLDYEDQQTSEVDLDSNFDDIDSVSVVAEKHRYCQNTEKSSFTNTEKSSFTPSSSLISEPRVNFGRGRAAFIQSIKNQNQLSKSVIETTPPAYENIVDTKRGHSFSFICEKNIRGEEPKPFHSSTRSTNNRTNPSDDNPVSKKSQILIDLKASLSNPVFDDELLKKVGRGRGRFLRQ